ncbi:MAG TPA: hypothetical protein PKD37_06950 [Oligoflexia bacterium]|nr:hypothetical protein [Oligoflexia bacterium]HMP27701.1 hypothetical protein [Oligoflexia bacterium]
MPNLNQSGIPHSGIQPALPSPAQDRDFFLDKQAEIQNAIAKLDPGSLLLIELPNKKGEGSLLGRYYENGIFRLGDFNQSLAIIYRAVASIPADNSDFSELKSPFLSGQYLVGVPYGNTGNVEIVKGEISRSLGQDPSAPLFQPREKGVLGLWYRLNYGDQIKLLETSFNRENIELSPFSSSLAAPLKLSAQAFSELICCLPVGRTIIAAEGINSTDWLSRNGKTLFHLGITRESLKKAIFVDVNFPAGVPKLFTVARDLSESRRLLLTRQIADRNFDVFQDRERFVKLSSDMAEQVALGHQFKIALRPDYKILAPEQDNLGSTAGASATVRSDTKKVAEHFKDYILKIPSGHAAILGRYTDLGDGLSLQDDQQLSNPHMIIGLDRLGEVLRIAPLRNPDSSSKPLAVYLNRNDKYNQIVVDQEKSLYLSLSERQRQRNEGRKPVVDGVWIGSFAFNLPSSENI